MRNKFFLFVAYCRSQFTFILAYIKRSNKAKLAGKIVLILTGTGIGMAFLFYWSVYFGLFGSLPKISELESIENPVASEIYSSDNKLLGKFYLQERTNVQFQDLPTYLVNALIATEDARFFEHHGVDFKSLARVAIKTVLMQQESSGGGSTITQQLVKNIFPRKSYRFLSTPINKVREMIIAKEVENIYSKQQILTMYLNTVSFGENAFGINTASQRFFSKSPDELSIQDGALLIGVLKATNTYNPRLHPERSIDRRNLIFQQMVKYEFLTEKEADSLRLMPVDLNYRQFNHHGGIATYFREHLRKELKTWCESFEKKDGSHYNLYVDGLKIFTTIDAGMQKIAEAALSKHMADLQTAFNKQLDRNKPWEEQPRILNNAIRNSNRYKQLKSSGKSEDEILALMQQPVKMTVFSWDGDVDKELSPIDSIKHYLQFLQAGFLAMDTENGQVLAWVGGIDHQYFQYDHVNINTKRQIGSTFKPIVYATAMENGVKPCDFVSAEQITYTNYEDWTPGNTDNNYKGKYSVKGALTNSVNTVSVKVLKRATIDGTIKLAHELGISSTIPEVPSIALGTPNISLYEMVTAYAVFANRGRSVKPYYILKITDKNDSVLYENPNADTSKKVLSVKTADVMTAMLQNVVNRGTAQSLRTRFGLKNEIAGKTGTTQSQADGWFIGYTPKLVAGVWVGSDDPNIHFNNITQGQGASMALPIWGYFMQELIKSREYGPYVNAHFEYPQQQVNALLACEDYKEYKSFLDEIFSKILRKRKSPKKQNPRRRLRKRNND